MSNDNKTLADVQPGGRVRLGDRPKDGEVLVEVSGLTGSGKSAIAGEIEILCKALGLDAEWVNGDEEKRLTHADWIGALEMYKPKVVIVERNIPRAALSAQPSPGGQGDAVLRAINSKDLYQVLMDVQNGIDSPALASMANGAIQLIDKARSVLAARQPVTMDDALAAGDGTLHGAIDHWQERALRAEAELAARQPVGEPVGWYTEDHLTDRSATTYDCTVADRWRAKGWPVAPLYAAPAQAVDLGQFREVVSAMNTRLQSVIGDNMMPWSERDKASKEQAALYPLLALIDSKAVGK